MLEQDSCRRQSLRERTYAMCAAALGQYLKTCLAREYEPLASVAFSSELIALVARTTDSAAYWARGATTATGSLVEHIALVARRYWATGVRQTVGLDDGLAVWQHMAVLVILQRRVLRGVRQSVERRRAHMLRGQVVVVLLLMVDHVRRGEMAERRRVLVQTG